jgi:hypothetical protein
MIKQFAANNLDKMKIMKFITKNSSHSTLHIGYKVKYMVEMVSRTFVVLQTDNHQNWKNHAEQVVPKLSRAWCTVRSVVHISNINTQINLLCML